MKLALNISTVLPRTEKIHFNAELAERLDAYMAFYQTQCRLTITPQQVISQMLMSFIKADRDFMRHYRLRADKVDRADMASSKSIEADD